MGKANSDRGQFYSFLCQEKTQHLQYAYSIPFEYYHNVSRGFENLFQGRRVLITPNAKPSKELLKSLVVAAHGQVCNL